MDTADYLLTKYGPLLSRDVVAEVFGYESAASFSNAVNAGRIKNLQCNGINRYHYRDVAFAIDALAFSGTGKTSESTQRKKNAA